MSWVVKVGLNITIFVSLIVILNRFATLDLTSKNKTIYKEKPFKNTTQKGSQKKESASFSQDLPLVKKENTIERLQLRVRILDKKINAMGFPHSLNNNTLTKKEEDQLIVFINERENIKNKIYKLTIKRIKGMNI